MKNVNKYARICFLFVSFLMLVLILEKDHMLRCGVLDDLTLNQRYLNSNFFEATFRGGYKFRPVANGIMWIIFNFGQGNLYIYGYINIMFAALCATIIYIFVSDCCASQVIPIIASLLYIFSRFSYYQISQLLGIMEAVGLIFGICVVYTLFKYIESKSGKYYYLSLLTYFLASLSHERYLTLFPVIIIAWMMVEIKDIIKNKDFKLVVKPISATIVFVFVMILFNIFVNNIMTGTGGTDVTETTSINSITFNLKKCIGYLFSINLDTMDMYLNMISWDYYIPIIKMVVCVSNIAILIIVFLYMLGLFKEQNEHRFEQLKIIIVYILSIGALLFISSVTIRVELRWMYFPYIVAVFMLIYMVYKNNFNKWIKYIKYCAIIVYALTTICFSTYCRHYYNNIYYWRLYTVGNDLIDETYGRYQEDMFEKSWVIVSNVEELNSYEDILNVYNPYDEYDVKIEVINYVEELSGIEDVQGKEILFFDANDLDFINITDVIKGYYN